MSDLIPVQAVRHMIYRCRTCGILVSYPVEKCESDKHIARCPVNGLGSLDALLELVGAHIMEPMGIVETEHAVFLASFRPLPALVPDE